MATNIFDITVMKSLIRFDVDERSLKLGEWIEFIPEEWQPRVLDILRQEGRGFVNELINKPWIGDETLTEVVIRLQVLLFTHGIDPKKPPI